MGRIETFNKMANQNGGLLRELWRTFLGQEAAQQMDILKSRHFQQGKYIYKISIADFFFSIAILD